MPTIMLTNAKIARAVFCIPSGALAGLRRSRQAIWLIQSEFASELARLLKPVFDPYHPELHYMRGPGPKWRAKHGGAVTELHDAPGLLRVRT